MEKFEDLRKLQELKEKGIMTEQEFEIEKSKILNRDNITNNKVKANKKNENVFAICVKVIVVIIIVAFQMKILDTFEEAAEHDLDRDIDMINKIEELNKNIKMIDK